MKISDVPDHIALAALSHAASEKGISYGALVAATTEFERQQMILAYYKQKRQKQMILAYYKQKRQKRK